MTLESQSYAAACYITTVLLSGKRVLESRCLAFPSVPFMPPPLCLCELGFSRASRLTVVA